MEESILVTIKKMLGLDAAYTAFDTDIVTLINAAIMTLTQLGVGPASGFAIHGMDETWDDLLTNPVMLNGAKEYIYMKVKMAFDPPSSSSVLDAMKKTTDELEWRLNVQAESAEYFEFIDQDDVEAAKKTGKSGGEKSCPFAGG